MEAAAEATARTKVVLELMELLVTVTINGATTAKAGGIASAVTLQMVAVEAATLVTAKAEPELTGLLAKVMTSGATTDTVTGIASHAESLLVVAAVVAEAADGARTSMPTHALAILTATNFVLHT